MGYFAGRAAPLGAVGPEVVTALFYNFAPSRVARALPDAWGFAPPEAALAARASASVAALRRSFGDDNGDATAAAAALARRAAESAPPEGRPLFAANGALPWPDDPVADLWHAATLLREHRGDGHVAVLTAAGVSGREANVLHSAAVGVPAEYMTVGRDYDAEEWSANARKLATRRLLTADGALTGEGSAFKAELEDRTDRIALSAYAVLDDEEIDAAAGSADAARSRRHRHRRRATDDADRPDRRCAQLKRMWRPQQVRASERQRASGQQRPAWPGNAVTVGHRRC